MTPLRKIPILILAIVPVAFAFLAPGMAAGQPVIINEVSYLGGIGADWVEFKNISGATVDISSYWVCARFVYRQLSTLTNLDGTDLVLSPGEITTVQLNFGLNNFASDLAIYTSTLFTSAAFMRDFVQWGGSGIGRESVAVTAGLWSVGDFVATAGPGQSMAYNGGNPNASSGYTTGTHTRSQENSGVVPVEQSTWGRVKLLYR